MKIPYYKQETDYTCGPAAMRMALASCGVRKSEKAVAKLMGTTKAGGTMNADFPRVAEHFKLNYKVKRNADLTDLRAYMQKGYALILCYTLPREPAGHYVVVKKITQNTIAFLDPEFGPKHKHTLPFFLKIWKNHPQSDNEKRWFFAVKR